jgi:hypothetical protein
MAKIMKSELGAILSLLNSTNLSYLFQTSLTCFLVSSKVPAMPDMVLFNKLGVSDRLHHAINFISESVSKSSIRTKVVEILILNHSKVLLISLFKLLCNHLEGEGEIMGDAEPGVGCLIGTLNILTLILKNPSSSPLLISSCIT